MKKIKLKKKPKISIKPSKLRDYSLFDKMIGSIRFKGKKTVNLSENVDEIYYR